MSVTSVKMDESLSNTATIKSLLNGQIRIINEYKNAVAGFEGNWSGEGYKAFVKSFADLNPKTIKHFENMQEYNKQIIKLLEKLQQVDNDSARLFRNV